MAALESPKWRGADSVGGHLGRGEICQIRGVGPLSSAFVLCLILFFFQASNFNPARSIIHLTLYLERIIINWIIVTFASIFHYYSCTKITSATAVIAASSRRAPCQKHGEVHPASLRPSYHPKHPNVILQSSSANSSHGRLQLRVHIRSPSLSLCQPATSFSIFPFPATSPLLNVDIANASHTSTDIAAAITDTATNTTITSGCTALWP